MGTHSSQRSSPLHFVGGPLDGYIEETDTPIRQLPEVLGILVSPLIVDMLTTQRLVGEMPPTSLAFYQQGASEALRYTYVGSTSPEAIEVSELDVRRAS